MRILKSEMEPTMLLKFSPLNVATANLNVTKNQE